ncbi:glycosyltransferase family 2 protein [Vibrio europaeus]|uniref:glycosyltransferase family 2 protein n=1 Tax=Vibrio europaeus TaxID=300876 RepID=UPI002341E21A|nr:glycosyltransferase family 2 protein [Vibrio europaeus]MDC5852103.1 glycosyltransferase family 2 protein [Vibrio europaeus]
MIIFELFFIVLTVFAAVPVLVISVQAFLAFLTKDSFISKVPGEHSAFVLIPAHNEEQGIAKTIKTVQPQLAKGHQILVVADNCSDDTAKIASSYGVEVVERFHDTLRGKCYALDFGIKHLADKQPNVVVFIDADCELSEDSLSDLVNLCAQKQRPVQCLDLMLTPEGGSVKTKIAAFAWLFKNWVRPLGFSKLSLPCQLMGTGMALPWSLLQKVNLANGSIVEDLKLGLDCAAIKKLPLFYPLPVVTSYFPTDKESGNNQRARWEHGHLGVIVSELPGFLFQAVKRLDLKMFMMVIDAAIPPLALFSMFILGVTLANSVLLAFDIWQPFALSILMLGCFFCSIFLSWLKFGKETISFVELLSIPVYILRKLPLYFKFLSKKEDVWVKTKRD